MKEDNLAAADVQSVIAYSEKDVRGAIGYYYPRARNRVCYECGMTSSDLTMVSGTAYCEDCLVFAMDDADIRKDLTVLFR